MKNLIKTRFPNLFQKLKNLYSITPYQKFKSKQENLKQAQSLAQRKKLESEIMNNIFNNVYIVHNGPFKGMKYIENASGSALLPKIIGSYEEPIQDWFDDIIKQKKYRKILDIGCAEGYYAVGLAMKLPDAKILAYDISEDARNNAKALKEINQIHNLEIKAECSHEELNINCENSTLIICDIEGHEEFLLDPCKAPNLKYADLIVESHDCFVPNITDELIRRFFQTHKISIAVDYPFRLKKYELPLDIPEETINTLMNERRSKYMKFLYLKHATPRQLFI